MCLKNGLSKALGLHECNFKCNPPTKTTTIYKQTYTTIKVLKNIFRFFLEKVGISVKNHFYSCNLFFAKRKRLTKINLSGLQVFRTINSSRFNGSVILYTSTPCSIYRTQDPLYKTIQSENFYTKE